MLILGPLIALGPLTIDMYLPALPEVGRNLNATASQTQLTITGVMIGLSVGQLLAGPLSDAFGRRRPLLIGLAVHVATSLLCALAPTVQLLTAARVLQGFVGAAISVTVIAVVRDVSTGRGAATLLSHLMLVLSIAPILAPTLGGFALTITSWRGIFLILALAATALLALAWAALTETLPPTRRRPAAPAGVIRTYVELLHDRVFVGFIVINGLTMATLFAYVAGSPFVLQRRYGLDEQAFGLVFGAGAVGMLVASQLNPPLLRRLSSLRLMTAGMVVSLSATAGLVVAGAQDVTLGWLLVPLFVAVAMCVVIIPNSSSMALSRHGESAGMAAALLGAAQFGLAGLISPVVGLVGTSTALPMAVVMMATSWAVMAVFVSVVRPWQLPPDAD